MILASSLNQSYPPLSHPSCFLTPSPQQRIILIFLIMLGMDEEGVVPLYYKTVNVLLYSILVFMGTPRWQNLELFK